MTSYYGNQVAYGSGGWYRVRADVTVDGTSGGVAYVTRTYVVETHFPVHDNVNRGSWSDVWGGGGFTNFNFDTNATDQAWVVGGPAQEAVNLGAPTIHFEFAVTDIAGGGESKVIFDVALPSAGGPPSAPQIGADSVTSSSVRVYTTVAGSENGATTTAVRYRAVRSYDGAWHGDIEGGYNGVTFTGMNIATQYTLTAQSLNAFGWGPWSAPVYITTLGTTPPAQALSVDSITATSARLVAGLTGTNGSTIDALKYRLYVTNGAYLGDIDAGWEFVWAGLTRATSYDAYVQAHNAYGWGPFNASPVRFTTLPSIPGAPTITSITSITPTSAVVSWSPPADNGGQVVTSYGVQYALDAAFTVGVSTLQPTGTLTGLTPGVTYYVRVRAGNASGAGPWSAVSSFTTLTGMKVYNGAAFVDAPVYAWNGTAWVACEVRIWNGSAWVPTG